MESYFGDFRLASLVFQRCLAAVYLVAFLSALNQFPALLGEKGLLPVPDFVRQVPFSAAPGIFQFYYSDRFFAAAAWAGILLSGLLLLGLPQRAPWWACSGAWLALYALYLSIVNAGQVFYSFGWETMLLEAGFLAAFLGPAHLKPSLVPVLSLRWLLFRLILGAGLIKLRGDPCWRDLTCLNYHFETQPMPNPLSWYFNRLPAPVLAAGVFFNHVVEVAAPWALLGPQAAAAAAGALIAGHQLMLIVSGNFSFLNFLTLALCLTTVSDGLIARFLPVGLPPARAPAGFHLYLLFGLGAAVALLSVRPVLNLASPRQIMNYSYNPFHLVGTYGMFGSITRERYEIVLEGTSDENPGPAAAWREYEFKGKPGGLGRLPPQVAPYHLRLDWLMWFLPFSVEVDKKGIMIYGYEAWYLRLVKKLLEGDRAALALLAPGPFRDAPPRYVRARFYRYRFAGPQARRRGQWWERRLAGEYMAPVDLRALGGVPGE
jgi:hypothetical protein